MLAQRLEEVWVGGTQLASEHLDLREPLEVEIDEGVEEIEENGPNHGSGRIAALAPEGKT
jgi:hypothetical protein